MDNQFNTLMRSYHDNYLQFKLTGDQKYQKAYESAKEGLDAILRSKKTEVDSDSEKIQNTLGTDAENKMKDVKSQSIHLVRGLSKEKDEETAAEMRSQSAPPVQSTTIQYVAIGVLLATIVGLSFL